MTILIAMITSDTLTLIKTAISNISFERCLLFGSQARGDAVPGSDYDLLLIVKDDISMPDRFSLATRIRKALAQKLVDVDLVIKPVSEVETQRGIPGSLVRNALLEGIAL